MEKDNMWEKIKKNFKDGAALSIEKIEEYSKIGKLKIEEFAAKKKIERNYLDIGQRVFDLIESQKNSEILEDIFIKKAIENIRQLNAELAEIDSKIKKISEEAKKPKNTSNLDSESSVGI
jgi:hypothetical protein